MNNLCKQLMLGGSMAARWRRSRRAPKPKRHPDRSRNGFRIAHSDPGYEAPPGHSDRHRAAERDAKADIGTIRESRVSAEATFENGSHSGNASQGDAGIDTIDLRGLALCVP